MYLNSCRAQELTAAIISYSYINVLQGSVAMQIRCGGIFTDGCRRHRGASAQSSWRLYDLSIASLKVGYWMSSSQLKLNAE